MMLVEQAESSVKTLRPRNLISKALYCMAFASPPKGYRTRNYRVYSQPQI